MVVAAAGSSSAAGERRAAEGRAGPAAAVPAVLPGEGVLPQREFEVGLAGVEAGLGQGPFQRALVALHEVQRFGAFDGHPGIDVAGAIDLELTSMRPSSGGSSRIWKRDCRPALAHDLEGHLRQVELGRLIGGMHGLGSGVVDRGHGCLLLPRRCLRWKAGIPSGICRSSGSCVLGRGRPRCGAASPRCVIAVGGRGAVCLRDLDLGFGAGVRIGCIRGSRLLRRRRRSGRLVLPLRNERRGVRRIEHGGHEGRSSGRRCRSAPGFGREQRGEHGYRGVAVGRGETELS